MINILFPSRIARLNYLFRTILFVATTWPLKDVLDQAQKHALAVSDLLIVILALALCVYWFLWIVRPRCRDAGMHWAWGFLILVPFINVLFGLVLLFTRSTLTRPTEEPNKSPEATALTRE